MSLFDHHDIKHKEASFLPGPNDPPPSSGYVPYRTQEEAPIFTKQKMKISLPDDITHLTVSKNWLYCLMSHQVLLRLFLPRPEKQDEVFLEKYLGGYNISKLFLDPTANHLLIALSPKTPGLSPDILYLHSKSTKPRRIEKFKDHEITAVAFNQNQSSESSTGPILLGTSRGLIFEAEFGPEGDKVLYRRQVFDLGREKPCQITGLNFFCVPNTNKYIVLAATVDRLYKFHETIKPDEKFSLQAIFNAYVAGELIDMYEEVTTDLKFSKLHFNLDADSKYPTHYGWLTGSGILYGEIDQTGDLAAVLSSKELIAFPTDTKPPAQNPFETSSVASTSRRSLGPKSFALTDFHALLIYSDHVTAVCLLNQETIYEEYFSEQHGRVLEVIKDPTTGSVFVYTAKAIFRYRIVNEKRNVWQLYLDKGDYDLAERYARDNPAYLDIVLAKRAEVLFDKKDYVNSAQIYSKTEQPFEQISLKFMELTDKKPLMIYLSNRLELLRDEDLTQITMIVVWLIELYLTEINRMYQNAETKKAWQREFDDFMAVSRVAKCVRANRSVVYDLMASHGDNHNLCNLALQNRDYESVVNQHINYKKYKDALTTLKIASNAELFYKYCPILFEEMPHETVTVIIGQEKNLDPKKMLPTIICLETDLHVQEVIRYLEYVIYSLATTESCLHNYLLELYAKYKPEKLLTYLETQGRDESLIHYNPRYALRVCQEYGTKAPCVFVLCLLDMFHPAVDMALEFDSALAKETANRPCDEEDRRELWLKIAKHEIQGTNDVKKALELLKECDLLRIEDLLPFFSDFEKIDHFKDAICDALRQYNLKIQELQKDMEESSKSADRVRDELQTLRNRSVRIPSQEKCAICEIFLLLKPFFIFPCGHKFHGDCLEKQIIPMLSPEQSRNLTSLKQQLESMLTQVQPSTSTAHDVPSTSMQHMETVRNNREQIKVKIENILASDCLYCGIMVESLDKPFIEDWDQEKVDWD